MPSPADSNAAASDDTGAIPTPRSRRALIAASFSILGLGLIVVGIAARHVSPWATVTGVAGGLVCFGAVVRYLEDWDEEDRHEAGRRMSPVKQPKLINEPGLKTVPRQFDALKDK